MNVYQSTLANFLDVFIVPATSLYIFIIFKNICTIETSLLAGFLFFLTARNFIQIKPLNMLYNNLNNKTYIYENRNIKRNS